MLHKTRYFIVISMIYVASPTVASHLKGDYIDLFSISIEELANIKVESASLIGSTTADTASWVEYIDESQWIHDSPRRTFDVLASQPNTLVIPFIGGGDAVLIRGYARTTSLRGISLLWDGVPLGDYLRSSPTFYFSAVNLPTLSSIEYTQGPGSALHGSDAFHGVIGMNSFDPGKSDPSHITLRKGNDGYYEVGARGALIDTSTHELSIALANNGQPDQNQEYQAYPSFTSPINGERDLKYDARTGVLKYAYHFDSQSQINAGYYFHRYESENWQGAGPLISGSEDYSDQFNRFNMGKLSFIHEFNDVSQLTIDGYYWDLKNDFLIGIMADIPSIGSVPAQNLLSSEQNRYGLKFTFTQKIESLRTRWAVSTAADYQNIYHSSNKVETASGIALINRVDAVDNRDSHSYNITGESQTRLIDDTLILHLGLRADHYQKFGTELSPRVGLIFKSNPHNTFKLIYSEAFRAPNATELYSDSSLAIGNEDLRPETLNNWEFIWLYQTENQKTQISAYHSRWENGIVVVVENAQSKYENFESNQSNGISISNTWKINPWTFESNGSWVVSKNKNTGAVYKAFPKYLINAAVSYHWGALHTDISLAQHWMFKVDDIVISNDNLPNSRLSNYSRTDLNVVHNINKQSDIILSVVNLFDKDNKLPSIATIGGTPDDDRTLSIGFQYSY